MTLNSEHENHHLNSIMKSFILIIFTLITLPCSAQYNAFQKLCLAFTDNNDTIHFEQCLLNTPFEEKTKLVKDNYQLLDISSSPTGFSYFPNAKYIQKELIQQYHRIEIIRNNMDTMSIELFNAYDHYFLSIPFQKGNFRMYVTDGNSFDDHKLIRTLPRIELQPDSWFYNISPCDWSVFEVKSNKKEEDYFVSTQFEKQHLLANPIINDSNPDFKKLSSLVQDFRLFVLNQSEYNKNMVTFISLSDVAYLSENKDSIVIPDLSERSKDEAKQFEYLKLNSVSRNRFLEGANVIETDSVFIFCYSKNVLISFPVSKLNVVACLYSYGAEWPYKQENYMIGFEIDEKKIGGLEEHFGNTMIAIGANNPFILHQLNSINWQKIPAKNFPLQQPIPYDTRYAGKCKVAGTYYYESNGFKYFVQDMVRESDNYNSVKIVVVIDSSTNKKVFEKIYYAGESIKFAELNQQWTGNLFKNKPSVLFGFELNLYGCSKITFLNPNEREITVYCDNRN